MGDMKLTIGDYGPGPDVADLAEGSYKLTPGIPGAAKLDTDGLDLEIPSPEELKKAGALRADVGEAARATGFLGDRWMLSPALRGGVTWRPLGVEPRPFGSLPPFEIRPRPFPDLDKLRFYGGAGAKVEGRPLDTRWFTVTGGGIGLVLLYPPQPSNGLQPPNGSQTLNVSRTERLSPAEVEALRLNGYQFSDDSPDATIGNTGGTITHGGTRLLPLGALIGVTGTALFRPFEWLAVGVNTVVGPRFYRVRVDADTGSVDFPDTKDEQARTCRGPANDSRNPAIPAGSAPVCESADPNPRREVTFRRDGREENVWVFEVTPSAVAVLKWEWFEASLQIGFETIVGGERHFSNPFDHVGFQGGLTLTVSDGIFFPSNGSKVGGGPGSPGGSRFTPFDPGAGYTRAGYLSF